MLPGDLCARISLIASGRYCAAARLINNVGLPNELIVSRPVAKAFIFPLRIPG